MHTPGTPDQDQLFLEREKEVKISDRKPQQIFQPKNGANTQFFSFSCKQGLAK